MRWMIARRPVRVAGDLVVVGCRLVEMAERAWARAGLGVPALEPVWAGALQGRAGIQSVASGMVPLALWPSGVATMRSLPSRHHDPGRQANPSFGAWGALR